MSTPSHGQSRQQFRVNIRCHKELAEVCILTHVTSGSKDIAAHVATTLRTNCPRKGRKRMPICLYRKVLKLKWHEVRALTAALTGIGPNSKHFFNLCITDSPMCKRAWRRKQLHTSYYNARAWPTIGQNISCRGRFARSSAKPRGCCDSWRSLGDTIRIHHPTRN